MTTRRMAKRALENETSEVIKLRKGEITKQTVRYALASQKPAEETEPNPIRLIIEDFIEPVRRNKIARFVNVMEESEEKREMYEVDIDFDGLVIPDHVPELGTEGAEREATGQFRPSPGFAYSLGYLNATLKAALRSRGKG